MTSKKIYKDYFNIDPKYYSAVTADLIESGKVSWKSFYPHNTFIKLLEKTHDVLSGKDTRSLWIEGAYGTGKSHAALTIKSLLEASDEEVYEYFNDYNLSKDLCQKIIADKNDGLLITIHRIGSASIRSDQDLILAIQDSIMYALKKHNIENHGEASLRDAALNWLSKTANRNYFNALISEDKYAWDFGGNDIDSVIDKLENGSQDQITITMRDIMKVAEDNGITALRLDIQAMCKWIKSIISGNKLKGILFIWDEFTEFFQNNPNSLTGFQTLAEISSSDPFYFLIVSHESRSLFSDSETAKKILDRFIPPIKIELPENMAFRLMAQAMKITNDPILKNEWNDYKLELTDDLSNVCRYITSNLKNAYVLGEKTTLNEQELKSVFPIHPYAALLLKHLSVAFSSNQRSMFDFIISNDMTDAKGFKWFISQYGPLDKPNLLTIDMLWDFFYGKGENGLDDDVRVILDSYSLLDNDKMTIDEQRVLKTILLFQAISLRISDVELLRPNEQNVDMAFSGTDWPIGKAKSISEKLVRDGLLFKRNVGGGKYEYTIANSTGDVTTIKKLKESVIDETKTQSLIINADLINTINLPASISGRYLLYGAAEKNFRLTYSKVINSFIGEKFPLLITFAIDDTEASQIKNDIITTLRSGEQRVLFIDASLTPMGKDLYDQYVESMAYSKYYSQNKDNERARDFQNQAARCLTEWKNKISSGAFMFYSNDFPSGKRMPNLLALQEELIEYNRQKYYYGLENYHVTDSMFSKGPLALGAECGITETEKGVFKAPNQRLSLANALSGAWKEPKYWLDPSKRNLIIVQIKLTVENIIKKEFDAPAGQICIEEIFDALQQAPFGVLPNNLTAFVLGFVLKEYVSDDYFWSNGAVSEPMSIEKMKTMIANVINQSVTPDKKYRPEYIRAMSLEQRSFLKCTSIIFKIPSPNCSSIENARDQIRIRMKSLSFPIWTIESILSSVETVCDKDTILNVIDDYCRIANTANGLQTTESDLANDIGKIVNENEEIIDDLSKLLTNDLCRKGMLAYIDSYRNGQLKTLGAEINDGGAYLDRVKERFSADAANWVWNTDTANSKIDDVILDYKIISESSKHIPSCTSLREVIIGWNSKTNNIKMPFDDLKKVTGDLAAFLEELYLIKQSNNIPEQEKEKFYQQLVSQGDAFEIFYNTQISYFKQVADIFIKDLDEDELIDFYQKIPGGQFTKTSTEYMMFIENSVKAFIQSQAKKRLKDIWYEKTMTSSPLDWSETYKTPILCMVDDDERPYAKEAFATMLENSPSESAINNALNYLKCITYYDKLNDKEERNDCFMKRVVGDYALLLNDSQEVRDELILNCSVSPYDWLDNSTVQHIIELLAKKKYKTGLSEKVWSLVEKMDAIELRKYLKDLISDNVKVGIEILKNN